MTDREAQNVKNRKEQALRTRTIHNILDTLEQYLEDIPDDSTRNEIVLSIMVGAANVSADLPNIFKRAEKRWWYEMEVMEKECHEEYLEREKHKVLGNNHALDRMA